MAAVLPGLALVLLGPATALAKIESTPEGIRFTYTNANAQAVFVAGDFNGWNGTAQPMTRSGSTFSAVVKLGPGDHEYKFAVDGQWFADSDNPATTGSYGNSLVRVGAKGEILAVEATSNTALSPKILLSGRYIGLFIGRRDEANQDRFGVKRPDFNIDLDFSVRVSEALDANFLTKIRNASQNTPAWQTDMAFDRGYLDLHQPRFTLRLFDNTGIGTWNDPLHLVGDIGPYHHEFGFEQQGLRAATSWRGFAGTLVYADNFRPGDPTHPPVEQRVLSRPGLLYRFNLGDTNKNVLALRLERDVIPSLHAGLLLRNDRGYNPGALSRVAVSGDSSRVREDFQQPFEHWTGGGADLAYRGPEGRWQIFGELLYGEASLHPGSGIRQTFHGADTTFVLTGQEAVRGESFPIDTSQRWSVGGNVRPWNSVLVRGAIERERHGLGDAATDSLRFLRNLALTYRAGVDVGLGRRLRLPVRLGVDFEYVDFDYPRQAPWNTQLWFADRNFWMEHGQHRLPVNRFAQLGGADATTWSPWLECTLWQGPPLVFRYDGHVYGSRIDREPLLVESLFKLTYPVSRRVRLSSDTRWARYDVPVLGFDGGFVSTFADVQYSFSENISVSLSYGVDPFVLDVITNEYDEIGRNEFLISRGATPAAARDRYLKLATALPTAERNLEREKRMQVEAIVRF